MRTYFTSDTHFGHANIIKYCNRPFQSVSEMDKEMIKNINLTVKEDDMLFFLGDFSFKRSTEAPHGTAFQYYRSQLKCNNIIFIKGNHDRNNGNKTIIESAVVRLGGKEIFCTHNPNSAICKFNFNFVGHVHEKWQFKQYWNTILVNVGMDVWNFKPIDINTIMSHYVRWRKFNEKKESMQLPSL